MKLNIHIVFQVNELNILHFKITHTDFHEKHTENLKKKPIVYEWIQKNHRVGSVFLKNNGAELLF